MKFGKEFLDVISQKVTSGELKHTDTVIVGDNSSGKSFLLRLLIEKQEVMESVYFIDAVNRGFDVSKVTEDKILPEYKNTIINTRIQEEFFNLKDSFNCYGTLTERIEQIYHPLEEKLQKLFEKLTGESFQIVSGAPLGEVAFREGNGLLSSGYQAIVRIFLELLYYQEKCVVEKHKDYVDVIIDELDEFLSPGYAYKIFSFIKENFPQMNLIVTTHSSDLIAGAKNANLIVLDNEGFEVMDADDYQSPSEVQIIFDRLFGAHINSVSEIEERLRRLFNNKMNGAWNEQEQMLLEELQKEPLTASQQLIYKQIMEW